MSRVVILLALAAGVFSVFRKDIVRLSTALRGPAQAFLKDVKSQIDAQQSEAKADASKAGDAPADQPADKPADKAGEASADKAKELK